MSLPFFFATQLATISGRGVELLFQQPTRHANVRSTMWEMPSSRQPPLLFHLAEAATGRSSDSGAGAFGSGLAEGASLQGGAYTLGAQIHRGPRSRVWRATSSASGSSVVIKVSGGRRSMRGWAPCTSQLDACLKVTPPPPSTEPCAAEPLNTLSPHCMHAVAGAGCEHTRAAAARLA